MQGQGQQGFGTQTTTDVFTDWLNKAGPDEKIYAAKRALAAIGELDTTHKDRFVQEVKTDPAITRLFDQLKTAV